MSTKKILHYRKITRQNDFFFSEFPYRQEAVAVGDTERTRPGIKNFFIFVFLSTFFSKTGHSFDIVFIFKQVYSTIYQQLLVKHSTLRTAIRYSGIIESLIDFSGWIFTYNNKVSRSAASIHHLHDN